jgi:hypothetical protein
MMSILEGAGTKAVISFISDIAFAGESVYF